MKMRALCGAAMVLILAGTCFAFTDLSVDQVKARLESGQRIFLVDVREPSEFDPGHIHGAVSLPWRSGVLEEQAASLPTDIPLVVTCQSGGRSAAASAFLEEAGFDPVLNMVGGMNSWTYGTVTTEAEQESNTCAECGGSSGSWGAIKAATVR